MFPELTSGNLQMGYERSTRPCVELAGVAHCRLGAACFTVRAVRNGWLAGLQENQLVGGAPARWELTQPDHLQFEHTRASLAAVAAQGSPSLQNPAVPFLAMTGSLKDDA